MVKQRSVLWEDHAYMCVCVCIYVCMYVYVYVCMFVCVFVYVSIRPTTIRERVQNSLLGRFYPFYRPRRPLGRVEV
jgi:hypothetical protein